MTSDPNTAVPTQVGNDHFLCEVAVVNEMGLHARPASLFVGIANKHPCDVLIHSAGNRVDGKSILQLLSLSAEIGTKLTLETRGKGARNAILELRDLIRRGFGDPPVDVDAAAASGEDAPQGIVEAKPSDAAR